VRSRPGPPCLIRPAVPLKNVSLADRSKPLHRMTAMTLEERRERARLRSERWRRAHGIGPRKPASKPWLAMGVSRSTWYRRGNRISGELSKKVKKAQGKRNDKNFSAQTGEVEQVSLARASAFVRELQAELAEVARCQAVTAGIIGELASAVHHPAG
jgi:hypothetical protein